MISVGDFTTGFSEGQQVDIFDESLDSDSNMSRVEQPLPPGRALGQRVKVSAFLEMTCFLGSKPFSNLV